MEEKRDKQLLNFKGIYHDVVEEKYSCPITGAHFRYRDICSMLEVIRVDRGDPDCSQLSLNLPYESSTEVFIDEMMK